MNPEDFLSFDKFSFSRLFPSILPVLLMTEKFQSRIINGVISVRDLHPSLMSVPGFCVLTVACSQGSLISHPSI